MMTSWRSDIVYGYNYVTMQETGTLFYDKNTQVSGTLLVFTTT